KTRDILAVEQNATRGRRQYSGQAIEESAFTGAIRPDDRANFLAVNLEIDVIHGGEAAESPRHPLGAEHGDLCARPGLVGRDGTGNSRLHRNLGRGELAGRREERLVAGYRFDDAVFPILEVEDDLPRERLMIFLTKQVFAGREIV